ncbi:MAG TPA: hypothetical protein PL009_11530 [Flavipsychrobacter sp.]|nr:hypothetical protein [Flavipsychrobacter sp.]
MIRHTATSNLSEIWDEELEQIRVEHICSPREHISDLSTSLHGVFERDDIYLELTAKGKGKYASYCAPNESVGVPMFGVDFVRNEDRGAWYVQIGYLDGQAVAYQKGDSSFKAVCHVVHTPMLWNFWHFSLRWATDHGNLEELPVKEQKKIAQKVGFSGRVLIARTAIVVAPRVYVLAQKCYKQAQETVL